MKTERIRLWDLPTRVFHWLLAILIVGAVITGNVGGSAIEWHGRIGLGILGLVVFRFVWGFIGSTYARFSRFIPTPSSIRAYLRGNWTGVGHNPLGALSVFALLALICIQVGTGIFSNDDIAFSGPLASLVDKALSDRLTGIHRLSINVLIALIALHLAAIAFYAWSRKDNLVKPMLNGWKDIASGQGESATGGGPVALVVALAIALGAVYAASGRWLDPHKPAATTTISAPGW